MKNAQGLGVRTPAQALADLDRRGVSIAAFARDHDLPYGTVYQVLHGKKKGLRGEAHRAAVLLRLKEGVIEVEQGETDDGSV
jgi:gp16 family phage-associated protein